MEETFNEDEILEEIAKKKAEQKEEEKELETGSKKEIALTQQINNSVSEYYESSISKNGEKIKELTDALVDAEIDYKHKQIEGQKKINKSKLEKSITKEKSELDAEKHERAKTVLKAQGLTEKLPSVFRVTALIIGFPFFLIYLLTVGWIVEFLTFVVKGFITMIYDCADRFCELNKKFIENGNNKEFHLGKAIFNILKYLIIIVAVIVIIVLFLKVR